MVSSILCFKNGLDVLLLQAWTRLLLPQASPWEDKQAHRFGLDSVSFNLIQNLTLFYQVIPANLISWQKLPGFTFCPQN